MEAWPLWGETAGQPAAHGVELRTVLADWRWRRGRSGGKSAGQPAAPAVEVRTALADWRWRRQRQIFWARGGFREASTAPGGVGQIWRAARKKMVMTTRFWTKPVTTKFDQNYVMI